MAITWEKESNTGDLWLKDLSGFPFIVLSFAVIGGLIMAGAVTLLVFIFLGTVDRGLIPLGSVMILFGLLFLLAGINNLSRQFSYYVRIDKFNKRLQFYRNKPSRGFSFPLGEIDRILLNKEVRTSYSDSSGGTSRARKYNVYLIYIVKIDGAAFWLDTFNTPKELEEKAAMLLSEVEVSCEDKTGCGLSRKMENPYGRESRDRFKTSDGVVFTDNKDGSREISLRRKVTANGVITLFLIFFFMGGLAGVAIFKIMQAGWIMAFIAAPVALVPIGIILLIIFIMQKRYRLILHPGSLTARIEFKASFLNKRMGKEVDIPADRLRSVRLNRYDGGGFRLQLGMDQDYPVAGSTSLLFSTASIGALGIPGLDDGEKVLPLWEMTPNTLDSEGASFTDLAALEQILQDYYKLER